MRKPCSDNRQHTENPTLTRVVMGLFWLNAAIWILLGGWGFVRLANQSASFPAITLIFSILMLGDAAALIALGWGISRQIKLCYYLSIMILAANILLSVTDEFGWFDLITLLTHTALLVLLIRNRSAILPQD